MLRSGSFFPYTLTVLDADTAGGREFCFYAREARVGRTAENDIVVKDPSVSRKHCRIFVRDRRHWIEDLGSANGTSVNEHPVGGDAIALNHGDMLTVGDVSFAFTVGPEGARRSAEHEKPFEQQVAALAQTDELEPSDEPPPLPPVLVSEVRLRDEKITAPEIAPRSPAPPPLLRDEKITAPEILPEVAAPPPLPVHQARPRIQPPPLPQKTNPEVVLSIKDEDIVPWPVAPRPPVPLPVAQPPEAERYPVMARAMDSLADEDSQLHEPTAAQKFRARREAKKTAAGRLALAWRDLSPLARALSAIFGLGMGFGVGVFTWVELTPPPVKVLPPEPAELVSFGKTIEESFGTGDVDYEQPDLKIFNFKATGATRIVGLLHYRARDVSSDELAVSINGVELGFVPPDTVNAAERDLELVLPADQIKRNEVNKLVFDNVRNPPLKDRWAVWNVWIELLPLPDESVAETPRAVKVDLERAQKFYELRDVGPDALFNAWRAYRDAWLKLESMPGGPPSDLYAIARGQQAESWRELDQRCKSKLVGVQRLLTRSSPDYAAARVQLEDMLRYFPTGEHPCHRLVQEQLEEL